MINLSIYLYGKPEWNLGNTQDSLSPKLIRKHAEDLHQHLNEVAKTIEKLQTADWSCDLALYSLELYKGITKKQAEQELKKLKIDPDLVNLMECEEEEED